MALSVSLNCSSKFSLLRKSKYLMLTGISWTPMWEKWCVRLKVCNNVCLWGKNPHLLFLFCTIQSPIVKSPFRCIKEWLQSLLMVVKVSCQTRNGDLNKFYTHKNQATRFHHYCHWEICTLAWYKRKPPLLPFKVRWYTITILGMVLLWSTRSAWLFGNSRQWCLCCGYTLSRSAWKQNQKKTGRKESRTS